MNTCFDHENLGILIAGYTMEIKIKIRKAPL